VRYALVILMMMGCHGGTSESAIDESAWKPIAELARTKLPPGPSADLSRALEIAERRGDEWRRAHTPAERVQSDEAIGLLVRWSRAGGGLPAMEPREVMSAFTLGQLAIEGDGVAAAGYLGNRLVGEGRTLLDAAVGTGLLRQAIDKAKQLGEPMAGWPVPADGVLVRIVAGEAMFVHDARTPEGRARFEAKVAENPDLKIPLGAALEFNSDDIPAFWIAALAGAHAGEPDAVAIERVKRAATTDKLKRIVATIERIATDLESLRAATK
jgi:hypothetical protein